VFPSAAIVNTAAAIATTIAAIVNTTAAIVEPRAAVGVPIAAIVNTTAAIVEPRAPVGVPSAAIVNTTAALVKTIAAPGNTIAEIADQTATIRRRREEGGARTRENASARETKRITRDTVSRNNHATEDVITTINKTTRPALAVLNLPTSNTALIAFAQGVHTGMTGNKAFPNPTPPLATLAASIDALVSAENQAATKVTGAVTARNVAKAALILELKQLRGYVQGVADADAENSATIIESARISVHKVPVRPARAFDAVQGPTTGTAKLAARSASKRAAYEWEYSTDGGKTWVAAPPSLQAKTTVTGLPAGTSVQFRYRAVTRTGAEDWSTPVTLLVK